MTKRRFAFFTPLTLIWLLPTAFADEPSGDVPDDIPVAEFMDHQGTMHVGDETLVDYYAPDQTMDSVADWIITNMTAAEWALNTDTGSHMSRILVFNKGARRVGVMVADFIMTPAMQRMDNIKGVQYQISGGDSGAGKDANSASSGSVADESNQ